MERLMVPEAAQWPGSASLLAPSSAAGLGLPASGAALAGAVRMTLRAGGDRILAPTATGCSSPWLGCGPRRRSRRELHRGLDSHGRQRRFNCGVERPCNEARRARSVAALTYERPVFYEVVWRQKIGMRRSLLYPSVSCCARAFCPTDTVGEEIESHLGANFVVRPGRAFRCASAERIELAPGELSDFRRLATDLPAAHSSSPLELVFLWGIGSPRGEELLGCGACCTIQALDEVPWPGRDIAFAGHTRRGVSQRFRSGRSQPECSWALRWRGRWSSRSCIAAGSILTLPVAPTVGTFSCGKSRSRF